MTVIRLRIATGKPERQLNQTCMLQTVCGEVPAHLKRSFSNINPGIVSTENLGVCHQVYK